MAEKVAKQLNIDKRTIVKCNDYEIDGDKNNPLWLIVCDEDVRVGLSVDEYMSIMENMKTILKENFELKLEKAILSEFPIDYDDVKAVVLEELKENADANIMDVINKVKLEHPNLFYNLDIDKLF